MMGTSVAFAIGVTLFASAMWGSWMQIVKRCPQYPVYGMTLVIYTVSLALLGTAYLFLRPSLTPLGLFPYVRSHLSEVGRIAFGGGAAALGVLVSLKLMHNAGLVVGTAVSGAAGSITGVLVAVFKEGLPAIPHAGTALVGCTVTVVLAGILCACASGANQRGKGQAKKALGGQDILLLMAFIVLNNGYIYGTSTGTKAGMHPFLICLFLCAGAFAATLAVSALLATAQKSWGTVLCLGASKKPLLYGALSAVCHYGGNLLSILCMPVLSATLSFLIGRSANIWTFFFGLYLGEFRGAGKRTGFLLAVGISLYVVGVLMIAVFFY